MTLKDDSRYKGSGLDCTGNTDYFITWFDVCISMVIMNRYVIRSITVNITVSGGS